MTYDRNGDLAQALLHFASAMSAGGDGDGRAYATRQGWLGAAGELTPAGREVAKAYVDQTQSRSAFRIG